jgi:4,5-DOPA dioxygenase extradiol
MSRKRYESGARIVYFSHGGGPLPILGDASHRAMIDFMKALPSRLPKPDLILVISAHWEEKDATLLGAENPEMFYDYYGFPDAAYEISYSAPGSPEGAEQIAGVLKRSGIASAVNEKRGFDHGLFIPLKMMFPKADIPCLQLSLIRGLALAGFSEENVLVAGSGFSFHNMSAFDWEESDRPDPENGAFQNWLIETCAGPLNPAERETRLAEWAKAPSARYCHPREEHLLPLHVCAAMAGKPAEVVFDDRILGKRSLAFLWE